MLYPQNGDRIVAIDSVTSLHRMYTTYECVSDLDHICSVNLLMLSLWRWEIRRFRQLQFSNFGWPWVTSWVTLNGICLYLFKWYFLHLLTKFRTSSKNRLTFLRKCCSGSKPAIYGRNNKKLYQLSEGPRDAPWQLKPCSMSHKCSSNCIW